MSETKAEARSRGERLRQLREGHPATVERTQALLRDQKQMEQAICRSIREIPKTIPEIATEIGRPSHVVLWFVAALRKYGVVIETGMRGDYPLYLQAKATPA
jgi:predicted transcriptional regulator